MFFSNIIPTSIIPEISIFCGALFILLWEVFFSKNHNSNLINKSVNKKVIIPYLLSLSFVGFAIFILISNFQSPTFVEVNNIDSSGSVGWFFNQMFVNKQSLMLIKIIALSILFLLLIASFDFLKTIPTIIGEFLALLMLATVGGLLLISAHNFLLFYLALELQGLSLYLLASLNRRSAFGLSKIDVAENNIASEAGLKYFILGSVASGMLLFGISLIYGFSGNIDFGVIKKIFSESRLFDKSVVSIANLENPQNQSFDYIYNSIVPNGVENNLPVAMLFGLLMVITAMFFKISSAPFHLWSPDVYQGSPTFITSFFATISKIFSVIALCRILEIASVNPLIWLSIKEIIILIAIISLAVGAFGAIKQNNFKRLFAYSSIAHIGFILLATIADSSFARFSVIIFYLLIYGMLCLAGFLMLLLTNNKDNSDRFLTINNLAGISKKNPLFAFNFSVIMFSTAGIPPLAGFFSKLLVIDQLIKSNLVIVAVITILFTLVSAYYYLRIVKIIYFDDLSKETVEIKKFSQSFLIHLVVSLIVFVNIFFLLYFEKLSQIINNLK
ncbi:MAG: NADH-quinone oxidoreductase subunit N [Rickettsiales bacterium]|jgi:NADH-quinone oxidoreductase subunit N|nr:NADH-quinone oxidoreductase subunit N [Rickettsiales bacterium]